MADKQTTPDTNGVMSKITMKTLGNPKAAAAFEVGDGKTHYLGRIVGFASSLKQNVDDKGEIMIGLRGSFKATKPDGSVIRSGVCYLPGGIQDMVQEATENAEGRVEFAFDLFTEAASNKAGYQYIAKTLIQPQEDDDIGKLEASLSPMPKISAPAATVE